MCTVAALCKRLFLCSNFEEKKSDKYCAKMAHSDCKD